MANGSCGGNLNPSPKFPLAIFGWIVFIALIIQSLMWGSDRRQVGIDEANEELKFLIN